jgi:hypothetical protein
MNYTILTAANDSYIETILDFINSYSLDYKNLIVYNLDLNESNLQKIISLKNKYNFILKTFYFEIYPEHVNLKKFYGLNCSYAFKPIIMYNEANDIYNKDKVLIWMDSANRFNNDDILHILSIVNIQGIYSPISAYENTTESIELNNYSIVKEYGITYDEHVNKLQSISSGIVGINYLSNAGFNILNKWYEDSFNKDLLIPDGVNRNNNRQDQTLLSILMYLYEKNNNIQFNKTTSNVKFWVKKDNSTIDINYIPFRLIEKHNNNQLAIIYCKNLQEAIITYANRKNISSSDLLENYIIIN